jgi:hypothetical protein
MTHAGLTVSPKELTKGKMLGVSMIERWESASGQLGWHIGLFQ